MLSKKGTKLKSESATPNLLPDNLTALETFVYTPCGKVNSLKSVFL